MEKRNCYLCNVEIIECMGYVLASDFLKLLQGESVKGVREICGLDMERLESTHSLNKFLENPEQYKRSHM